MLRHFILGVSGNSLSRLRVKTLSPCGTRESGRLKRQSEETPCPQKKMNIDIQDEQDNLGISRDRFFVSQQVE